MDKNAAEFHYDLSMKALEENDINGALVYLSNALYHDPTEKKYFLEYMKLAIDNDKLIDAKEKIDELPNMEFSLSDEEVKIVEDWKCAIVTRNDSMMRKYLEIIKKDDFNTFYEFYDEYRHTCYDESKIRDQFGFSCYHYMVMFKERKLLASCGPDYEFYEKDEVENNSFMFYELKDASLDDSNNDLLFEYFMKYDRDANELEDSYKKQKRNNSLKKGANGIGKFFKALGGEVLSDMERNFGEMSRRATSDEDKERYSDAKEQAKGYKESYKSFASKDIFSTRTDDELYEEYTDGLADLYVKKFEYFKKRLDNMKNSSLLIERIKYRIIKDPKILEYILEGDYSSYSQISENGRTYCLPQNIIDEKWDSLV